MAWVLLALAVGFGLGALALYLAIIITFARGFRK